MDLSNFFSAAEARNDRWRQMNATGLARESAFPVKPENDSISLTFTPCAVGAGFLTYNDKRENDR